VGAGLSDLGSSFVVESTARVLSLRRGVEGPDRATVHDLAHSLKGIAGTFGDVATMRLCTTMQEHAAIGDPELLRQLTDDLAVTLRRSYRDLDRYLASQVS
jgi:HPt (histidine-containing phosphotransfer) domain-containing protein